MTVRSLSIDVGIGTLELLYREEFHEFRVLPGPAELEPPVDASGTGAAMACHT